jgi:hypothetical protein
MKALGTLLTTLVLVACGGGGGGGGSPAVATGQFTDSPVKGLQYRTVSQSGDTGANGEFRYLPGETVTFFVGDITLGSALGGAKITPFDLAGITPPTLVPSSDQTTVAFDQAINLAIFLQTLDADGNPDNGIEIPAQIRTMARGVTLDFKQQRNMFASTFALRKLIGAGRTAGLWGGVNAIRTPTLAIKAMYASLNIAPVMDLVTKVEAIDPNNSKVLWRQTIGYDNYRNRTQIVSEYDNNGVLERSTTIFLFDANGNAIHDETDANGDGRVDGWTDTSFNVNGDPTLSTIENDLNGDGALDSLVTVRLTYNVETSLTGVRVEYDNNYDGVVDSIRTETRSYDANGNRTLTVSMNDGVVDHREEVTYDSQGHIQMSRTEDDTNYDGVVDSRTTDTFDANGHVTLSEEDTDLDGTTNKRTTFTYDANGNRVLTETDTNVDGIVDSRLIYAFDAKGHQIRRDRDSNADGVLELRTVSTYDVNGYLILTEDDMGGDGVIDQQTTFVHEKVSG